MRVDRLPARYSEILHTNPTKMSIASRTCHMITPHCFFEQCFALWTRFYAQLFHQPNVLACFWIVIFLDFATRQPFMPFNLAKRANMCETFGTLSNRSSWAKTINLGTIWGRTICVKSWIHRNVIGEGN